MFTGLLQLALPADGPRPATYRARVTDREGLHSEWVGGSLEAPREMLEGEICDNTRLLCAGDALCAEARCTPPGALVECPVAWEAYALEVDEFGLSVVQGDNTGAPGLIQGSCGGGTATQVYRFVPPLDARYEFALNGEGFEADSVLYIRDFCAFDETPFAGEVACNDDTENADPAARRPLGSSTLQVDLSAGVPYFVFIDSSEMVDWRCGRSTR